MNAHIPNPCVRVIIMVGIPGSGKDTAIAELKEEAFKYPTRVKFYDVSRDNIRFSLLQDGEDYFAHEKEVEQEYYSSLKKLIKELAQGDLFEREHSFIIANATHITRASRKKLMNKLSELKDVDIKYTTYFINTPVNIAIERNDKRSGLAKVPKEVILNMNKRLEIPNKMLEDLETTVTDTFDYYSYYKEGKNNNDLLQ